MTKEGPSIIPGAREGLYVELRTLVLTSIWLFICLQYFLPFLFFLPIACIPVYGAGLYRKLTGYYDHVARIGVMCIPYSWCRLRVMGRGFHAFRNTRTHHQGTGHGNAVTLSSHCSRVDWLIGLYMGVITDQRIGFVAEATVGLLPLLGWSRVLFGDIFVTRAFHKDLPKIDGNIKTFHKAGVKRIIFLAPEGFIADPGSAIGDAYIPQCDEFMKAEGREPLTHLLTPRYKGMQAFVTHAPTNVMSMSMGYVQDAEFNENWDLVGGKLLSRALKSPQRIIPDLHSVFRGGLCVIVQGGMIDIDPANVKKQLLDDQTHKDNMLRHLEQTGKFITKSEHAAYYKDGAPDIEDIAAPHYKLNAVMVGHTALSVVLLSVAFGMSLEDACYKILYTILSIMLMHGGTHYTARWSTGVESRESICGETAVKAFIGFALTGAKLIARAGKGVKLATRSASAMKLGAFTVALSVAVACASAAPVVITKAAANFS